MRATIGFEEEEKKNTYSNRKQTFYIWNKILILFIFVVRSKNKEKRTNVNTIWNVFCIVPRSKCCVYCFLLVAAFFRTNFLQNINETSNRLQSNWTISATFCFHVCFICLRKYLTISFLVVAYSIALYCWSIVFIFSFVHNVNVRSLVSFGSCTEHAQYTVFF